MENVYNKRDGQILNVEKCLKNYVDENQECDKVFSIDGENQKNSYTTTESDGIMNVQLSEEQVSLISQALYEMLMKPENKDNGLLEGTFHEFDWLVDGK